MVKSLPAGPVCPGTGQAYVTYDAAQKRFAKVAREIGIPAGVTPHSLRHAFVRDLLSRGVPITDVAEWCGRQTITVTFKIYGGLVESAADRARDVLDDAYAEWSQAA